VVAPSDPWQAAALLRQLHTRGGPAYLRIDKSGAGAAPGAVRLGEARLVRGGADAVIFAIGGILGEALGAAELLAGEGYAVRVIDIHTIKPIDALAIRDAARECRHVVTLEEHTVIGGLGGAIAEVLMDGGVHPASFRRFGLDDAYPAVVGDQAYLRRLCGLDRVSVANWLRGALSAR
jgi:transketolase